MRISTKLFTIPAFAIASIFALTSCDEDTTEVVDGITPTISAEISGSVGEDSATIAIETTDADQIYYTYYTTSQTISDDEKTWSSVDVTDDTAQITISELLSGTQYKAELYALCGQTKSLTISIIFTTEGSATTTDPDAPVPTIAVVNNAIEGAVSTANLTVSVTDATEFFYTYYLEDSRPDSPSMTLFSVDGDGDYTVELTGIPVSATADQTFTFEAYATNISNVSQTAYASFSTTKSETLIMLEQIINPLMAVFNIDIVEEACAGYAYSWGLTAWFSADYLVSDISYNKASVVTEDGELLLGATTYLVPGSAYSIAIAPISYNADGTYYQAGDISTYEFTPPTFEIGTYSATVELEINQSETTVSQLGATLYNNDDVSGVYYGCMEASRVVDGDIEAAIITYFDDDDAYIPATGFKSYDYSSSSYVSVESLTTTFTGLDDGTEYYIFTVAITEQGGAGSINYVAAQTEGLDKDSSIMPIVTIEVGASDMTATIDFNGCDKVFLLNQSNTSGWYSESAIENLFIADINTMSYGYSSSKANSEGILTYSEDWLVMGESYTLYYLGFDANGVMGELQSITYETIQPTYDSSAKVYVREDSSSCVVTDTTGSTYVSLVLNVTMSGATSYIYSTVHQDYIGDTSDMTEWGDFVLSSYVKYTTDVSQLSLSIQSRYVMVVLIPIDESGNYGTPTVYSTPLWNDVPIEDDNNDDTVSPMSE